MRLNTIIRLPDGREGTICWHNLDGYGGVWDRHVIHDDGNSFSDAIPAPEFMLRSKEFEGRVGVSKADSIKWKVPVSECVGEEYVIVEVPE